MSSPHDNPPVPVIRVLTAADEEAVRRELARVGAAGEGVRLMASKGLLRLLRLDELATPTANLLKQEMLAAGGDAAVHAEAARDGVAHTGVVLIGTEDQYTRACDRLREYPGLAALAGAIRDTLRQYDTRGGELRCGKFRLPLGRKTYVMGILNLTPDSFSGDGLGGSLEAALRRAEQMVADGADILDVGGESTRPGAEPVPLEEEIRRVAPVIAALAGRFPVPISVDTYKSVVAAEALAAGATIVNDISGLRFDPDMAAVSARGEDIAVVVMHIKGTPRTMQQNPHYDDLMTEVYRYLQESTALAEAAGIPRSQVILDPGFGFGKTTDDNLELVRRLRELTSCGQPVLLGPSRKSTIGRVLGGLPPEERLEGTAATVALGIANGADIVRVHDVKEMARVARMTDAIVRG